MCASFGDLQCSVRAILGFDNKGSQFTDAVVNISTSAQVVKMIPCEMPCVGFDSNEPNLPDDLINVSSMGGTMQCSIL